MRAMPIYVLALALAFAGCDCSDDDDDDVRDGSTTEDGSTDNDGSSTIDGDVSEIDTGIELGDSGGSGVVVLCGDVPCECSDGIDNDEDGTADGFDIECTGAADNDEDSFATGVPGDNRDQGKQDCFFDGNSGRGGGDCQIPTECITEPETASGCDIADNCGMRCEEATPSGCDCFGCCTIFDGETSRDIYIGSPGCDAENIDDEEVCLTCQKTEECNNPCDNDECQLCPGQDVDDLPESCTPDAGTPYRCDEGQDPCSPEMPCAEGYCQSGCCVPVILI